MKIVKTTESEVEVFDKFVENDEAFTDYIDWREKHAENYRDDVTDIYNLVKKSSPEIVSPEEKPLLQTFMNQNNADIQDMKRRAKGSEALSFIASQQLAKVYDGIIDDKLKSEYETQKNLNDAKTKLGKEQLQKQLDQQMKRGKTSMRLETKKKMKDAVEEFEAVEDAIKVMGIAQGNGTESKNLTVDAQVDLLKTMQENSSVKEIMKLAGKFINNARHSLMTKSDAPSSIVGVTQGNDLNSLLDDELAMLVNPAFATLKKLQLVQSETFQYKYNDETPKTGGPIVVCIDESHSMSYWNLIAKAKAFLFGIYQVAKAENRKLHVVRYGGYEQVITSEVNDITSLMHVVTNFIDSDRTNFESALREAKTIVENGGEFENADIIFITDGESRMPQKFLEEFNAFKEETSTKVVSLALTDEITTLKKFSSEIVYGYDSLMDISY